MTTQIPMNEETKGMIYQKVLTATIDEKLKMQEAKRNKIEVSDKDIDASIASFAEVNKIPLKNIPSLLRKMVSVKEPSANKWLQISLGCALFAKRAA